MLEKLLDAILRENADIAVCNFVYEMSGLQGGGRRKESLSDSGRESIVRSGVHVF